MFFVSLREHGAPSVSHWTLLIWMIKLEGALLSENYSVDAGDLRLNFCCQFYLPVVQRTQRERACYLKQMCAVKCYVDGTRFPDIQ